MSGRQSWGCTGSHLLRTPCPGGVGWASFKPSLSRRAALEEPCNPSACISCRMGLLPSLCGRGPCCHGGEVLLLLLLLLRSSFRSQPGALGLGVAATTGCTVTRPRLDLLRGDLPSRREDRPPQRAQPHLAAPLPGAWPQMSVPHRRTLAPEGPQVHQKRRPQLWSGPPLVKGVTDTFISHPPGPNWVWG